jgi:hypothetical protein
MPDTQLFVWFRLGRSTVAQRVIWTVMLVMATIPLVAFSADRLPEPQLRLQAVAPAKPVVGPGEEIRIEVVLSTPGEAAYEFLLGAVPQVFGIYILGPWGPVQPDPTKVRPENWMHQAHGPAARISVAKHQPYRVTIKLSDYFPLSDTQQFKPGVYQVNVKFYEIGLGMRTPIDSGPVRFEIRPKKESEKSPS